MGDCSEAYFGAKGGEEYMLVDKEAINCQFNVFVELDEIPGNFDNTLRRVLAIPMNCIPFQLEDRSTPNHFHGLDIIKSHI